MLAVFTLLAPLLAASETGLLSCDRWIDGLDESDALRGVAIHVIQQLEIPSKKVLGLVIGDLGGTRKGEKWLRMYAQVDRIS